MGGKGIRMYEWERDADVWVGMEYGCMCGNWIRMKGGKRDKAVWEEMG